MPNRLALASSTPKITHDPTVTIQGDPMGFVGTNPYGTMTDTIIFGAVNTMLTWIDDATGLDLEGMVLPLESLLGGSTGLLSGLLGWLTPGNTTTTPNVLSPITSLLGAGNLLGLPVAIAQLGLNAVLGLLGLTGATPVGTGTSTGTSNSGFGGLLGALASIPLDLLALLLGSGASQQAQINAIQTGGFVYDPAVNGVSVWTTLTPTPLALSPRGAFIQPAVITTAYRSSGLSTDRYGANTVIDPTMRGVSGVGICADSAGASWVGLLAYHGFDGDSLWLVTAASPTLWVIQQQVDLVGVNRLTGPTTLDLKTDGVSKFTASLNGHPIQMGDNTIEWPDTGLATHDASHRGVILLANGLDRNEDSYYGPALKGKTVSYAA